MSKGKHSKQSEFVQLSLWDIPTDLIPSEPPPEELPLPLRTAQKWNFPLAYVATNGKTYYACQDWYKGLSGGGKGWKKLKSQLVISSYQLEFIKLPYLASDNKTYQADYTTDSGLYVITQEMRGMEKRPQLEEIRGFLAQAGAFTDLIMTNAAAADTAISMLEERHNLARQQGKAKRNFFTDIAYQSNINKAPKYGVLTNIEYKNLFRLKAEKTATNELIQVLKLDTKQAKHLRDHLSTLALTAVDASETTAAIRMQQLDRLLTDDEQSEIVRQCARKVSGMFYELAEFAGIDLLTGRPMLGSGQ